MVVALAAVLSLFSGSVGLQLSGYPGLRSVVRRQSALLSLLETPSGPHSLGFLASAMVVVCRPPPLRSLASAMAVVCGPPPSGSLASAMAVVCGPPPLGSLASVMAVVCGPHPSVVLVVVLEGFLIKLNFNVVS